MAGNSGIAVTISAVDRASKTLDLINCKITQANAPVQRLQKSFDKLASNTGVRDVGRFMGDLAKSSEQVFANVSRAVPGFAALGGALSLAGLAEGMKRSADYGTHLQLTARRAGVGVGSLQRLGNAAEISGGSFQGATESLADLNKNMQLMAHGGQADAQFTAAAAALHINLRDANGQVRSSASVMDEALHKLAKMRNAQQQLYFGNALLGSSFQTALFPAVQGGTKALDDYLKAGAQMVSLTPQQTEVLREAQAQTRRLGTDVVGLANQIMSDLAPAEVKAAGGMSQWIEKNQQWVAADVAGRIKAVTAEINSVVSGLGGWQNASSDLLEFWGAKFAPGILGPLLRADALIRAIEQNWQKHAIPGTHTAANAARGAATGAAVGSVVPIIGTGVGATIGGIAGALWDNDPFGGATPADAWRYMFGGGKPTGAAPTPPTGAQRQANMEATRQFWKSKGFTDQQVAGILAAGPAAESGFNPTASGDNGTSYGMYQWHNDRMRGLVQRYGMRPTVDQQNEYAWQELNDPQNRNLLRSLHAANTPEEAARRWTLGFERPAGGEATADLRAKNAELFMPQKQETATTIKGGANLRISLDGFPSGTHVSSDTYGNVFSGAPQTVMPLPALGGPPT